MRMNGRASWGIILIAAGVFFLLDGLQVLDAGEFFAKFWPVLLVIWGAWLLLRPKSSGNEEMRASGPLADVGIGQRIEDSSAEKTKMSNVFGDVQTRITSTSFSGGSLSTVFGDVEVNLTGAALAAGEQVLKLDTVMGEIEVRLPREMAFSVTGDAVLGKVKAVTETRNGFFPALDYASPGYKEASRRIRIDASVVFGEIVITYGTGQ